MASERPLPDPVPASPIDALGVNVGCFAGQQTRRSRGSPLAWTLALVWPVALAADKFPGIPRAIPEVERCIVPAATYQNVNPHILRAILAVESGMRPDTVALNKNGTVDLGMAQINSSHLGELARYGITPAHLMEPCRASYVAAWHLRRMMDLHGNSLQGIASYHSSTPYFNRRYQILLTNQLIRQGVVQGPLRAVPPLRPAPSANSTPVIVQTQPALPSAMVFDRSGEHD